MTVGVRDWSVETHNHWINITFEVEHVQKVALKKTENYTCAVVFRLNIGFFDGDIYLDFFPFSSAADDPTSYDDTKGVTNMMIIGKKGFWCESPYAENDVDSKSSENGE